MNDGVGSMPRRPMVLMSATLLLVGGLCFLTGENRLFTSREPLQKEKTYVVIRVIIHHDDNQEFNRHIVGRRQNQPQFPPATTSLLATRIGGHGGIGPRWTYDPTMEKVQ